MRITLASYNNEYFPVIAYWNRRQNSAVFTDVESAKRNMIARFGNCIFLDKTKKGEENENN